MRLALISLSCGLIAAQDLVKLPDGDGKVLVERVCSGCHSLETAVDTARTDPDWRRVVDSMAGRGAKATDAEFDRIVAYLAKNFGKAAPAVTKTATEGSSPKAEARILSLKADLKNDWPQFGRDSGAQRYSPLTQINVSNVAKLKPAWQYGIDLDAGKARPARRVIPATEAVPIVIGNVLFTPTAQHTIVALEADTGREIWKYELAGPALRCAA